MRGKNPASINDTELMKKIEKMFIGEQMSVSTIADCLGLTKNQVIGLINNGRRHGYNLPKRPPQFWRMKRLAAKGGHVAPLENLKRKAVQAKSAKVKAAQFRPVAERKDPIDPALRQLYENGLSVKHVYWEEGLCEEGVSLLDLHARGCKYPVGEFMGSHRFCAKPAEDGTSYCAEHLKVMWPKKYGA